MTDPVAAKSGFLSMYMSNHPDTLVAYVSHYTKNTEISSASMKSIDSKGMDMTYTLKGHSTPSFIRIPFDPPLMGYEEVKPRLMSMKVDAEESLGMAKNPTISEFSVPWGLLLRGPLIPQLLLIFLTYSSSEYAAWGRSYVEPYGLIKFGWGVILATHIPESIYTLSLCTRHKTGLTNGFLWCAGTILLGYPFWVHLRRLVKTARIDSIMKGQ
ncbi:hypothetical protein M407DRAFT_140133 [Tulasnella calospora MUT 4182]|uniref:DUF2470 domain-containing protein n=1 Tax=Tulasnella calospora MUT 4182 TaxID=1051891 RepID=A0A0C3PY98_9AGAM|nr:hypothetical protein M407DRAFT_140133 [Tulasnella calospora MUT 4182]